MNMPSCLLLADSCFDECLTCCLNQDIPCRLRLRLAIISIWGTESSMQRSSPAKRKEEASQQAKAWNWTAPAAPHCWCLQQGAKCLKWAAKPRTQKTPSFWNWLSTRLENRHQEQDRHGITLSGFSHYFFLLQSRITDLKKLIAYCTLRMQWCHDIAEKSMQSGETQKKTHLSNMQRGTFMRLGLFKNRICSQALASSRICFLPRSKGVCLFQFRPHPST